MHLAERRAVSELYQVLDIALLGFDNFCFGAKKIKKY
jgi:hypothetical protein